MCFGAPDRLLLVSQVMQDAVTEAVQAAVDEGMKFDVRANLYTMVAITGEHARACSIPALCTRLQQPQRDSLPPETV